MTEEQQAHQRRTSRFKRISAITGAGLIAGLVAAAIGGVASAQTVVESVDPEPVERVVQPRVAQADSDGEADEFFGELSPEDEAVFDRFEQCLSDAGVPVELDEAELEAGAVDEDAIDAAFEACDPIREELSDGFDEFFGEWSPEDEAVFDRFEQCLSDAGVPVELDEAELEAGAVDEDAIDAAFEACDPILDELSDGFDEFFGELSPEDEAVFEQYDDCIENGGIDALFENGNVDEAAIDALFETCDPILDNLSPDAQGFFEDCPDDDDEIHDESADVTPDESDGGGS